MKIDIKHIFSKPTPKREKNNHFENTEIEKCVLCGNYTDIPCNRNISWRKYYIIGCGQLCKKCYDELKYSRVSENASSDKSI